MNKEYILSQIRDLGISLERYSNCKECIDDEDIVLEAVRSSGLELKYASKRLRDNSRIVIEAIKQDPIALKYASKRLKGSSKIVALAIKNEPRVILFVDRELLKDVCFVSDLLSQNEHVAQYLPKSTLNKIYGITKKR